MRPGQGKEGCGSSRKTRPQDASQPGLFEALATPKSSDETAAHTSLPKVTEVTKAPPAASNELRKAKVLELVDPEQLATVLRGGQFLSTLPLRFSPEYETDLLERLARVEAAAKVRPVIPGYGPTGISQSHDNELKMHEALKLLAERVGPVALLDRILIERVNTYEKRGGVDNRYLARMFRDEGLDRGRKLGPFVQAVYIPKGSSLTPGSIDRKRHPFLLAQGQLVAPEHPKETALRALVENASALKNGGRVLVICENGATNKYLAEKSLTWERVSTGLRALTKESQRASIARAEGAYMQADRSIEVLVLRPEQLKGLHSQGVSALHAAMVVVHSLGVNPKTEDLKLPGCSELPMLYTKQVVQLSTTEHTKNLKKPGYDPLNLKHVIDDAGSEAPEKPRYWDR